MSMCGPTFKGDACILHFEVCTKQQAWIWYKIAVMNQLHNDKLYDVVGE